MWPSVSAFKSSETYAKMTQFHAWTEGRLSKFVAAYSDVFSRVKRNGVADERAASIAMQLAFESAKRSASEETMSKLESGVHYFAIMAPTQISGNGLVHEAKFNIVTKHLDFIKALAVGSAFNWEHERADQFGAIRDVILTSSAPPEIQKTTDPAIPFLFVASYRNDIPSESRNESAVSAEWIALRDGEVIPLTFCGTHTPANPEILGIKRVGSSMQSMQIDSDSAAIMGTPLTGTVVGLSASGTTVNVTADAPIFTTTAGNTVTATISAASILPAAEAKNVEPPSKIPPATSDPRGESSMPGETQQQNQGAPPVDAEARFASLNTALEAEKKLRSQAELNAAAWKSEFETSKRVVDEMKVAATKTAGEKAALSLLSAGKITADQANYFADLYLKMGEQEFERLAASLPTSTTGAFAFKASVQNLITSEADQKASRERLAKLLKEN